MKFFCPIALRDWFINLCDCFLRAGEQALDHHWPCGTSVFPPTRRFATSQGKCLREAMALLMSQDPLASPVLFVCLFVCLFVFSSQPHTYFIVGEETPVQKCWYWRPTRKLLPINQSEEGLNSNHDLIIRVFKSLIVAITFSSHKACKVHTL